MYIVLCNLLFGNHQTKPNRTKKNMDLSNVIVPFEKKNKNSVQITIQLDYVLLCLLFSTIDKYLCSTTTSTIE